jgi:hypothetical protein
MQEVEKEIEDVLEVVTTVAEKENGGVIELQNEITTDEVKQEVDQIKSMITEEVEPTAVSNSENGSYDSQTAAEAGGDVESENVPSGRIMMYVDLNYMSDEAFFERQKTIGAIDVSELQLANGNKLFDVIEEGSNSRLVTGGDLQVDGELATNTITTANIVDLTIKLNENKALKVINQEEETVFAVDDKGKITLAEGENSSLGTIIMPAGQSEVFVPSTVVHENSKIILEANQAIALRGRASAADGGFWVEASTPTASEVKVNYLLVN